MIVLYLAIAVLTNSFSNIFNKQYDKHATEPNPYLFTAICSLFTMLFFVVSAGFRLTFSTEYLPYSLTFGFFFGLCSISMVLAVKYGSFSLSSLFMSFSLIVPTLYGILFLHDQPTKFTYVGFALLAFSLVLTNLNVKDMKVSAKWFIAIILASFSNGMCSVVQKMEQMRFDGGYKSEYMIVALLFVVLITLLLGLMQKGNKKQMLRDCAVYAPIRGITVGALNLFVMILTGLVQTAVLFPVVCAGSIVILFFFSIFVYKEKLTRMQIIGYIFGILSVVFLNL